MKKGRGHSGWHPEGFPLLHNSRGPSPFTFPSRFGKDYSSSLKALQYIILSKNARGLTSKPTIRKVFVTDCLNPCLTGWQKKSSNNEKINTKFSGTPGA